MAFPDFFPFEKLIPVQTELEITGSSKYLPHAKTHGNLAVLQDFQKIIPGILKRWKKHIIKRQTVKSTETEPCSPAYFFSVCLEFS